MGTVQETRTKAERLAERDPQVYHPLDRLRGIIRRYVVIEGVLSAVLFVAFWFTLGLILDYGVFKTLGWDWVQDGARWLRGAALVTALALFAAILVFRIVRRLTTEFSYASLALVLERRFPKMLGDRLITAVEMADVEAMGKFGYSKDMLRATIAEARERVAKVPVSEVFNWRRLWLLGFLAAGLLLATLVFSYASYAIAARSGSPVRFGWKFAHVSGIFMERNVALMNTPWPRRAHIELVAFPEDGELTVGRDAPPPKITARAYRWVIADSNTPAGWRPLRWSDLTPELAGRSVPELPPTVLASAKSEAAPSVDTVERLAYESGDEVTPDLTKTREKIKNEMNAGGSQNYEELQEVFKTLQAKADQPSMGRTLRRLDLPGEVSYKFSGRRTAGNGTLPPQQNNEFAGEIGGLKEDVEFVIKAADFSTIPQKIRLIPPPSLRRLGREQLEPAYLHHAPPQGEGYDALKGRLQKVNAKELSLTGDRTVFVVPAGTDLTLVAEAYTADDGSISDNDRIVSAFAIPVTGHFPGTVYDKGGKPTQTPVPLKLTGNGEGFRIEFTNHEADPNDPTKRTNFRLHENVEFKVTFTNRYNVSTTRAILIQVAQDQAPVVEVAVDVIRKSGNVYLVTPNARIPFNTDSFIKDDHGLSNVQYVYEFYAEDSDLVRGIRTKYALRSLLDVPLPGTTFTAFSPRMHARNFRFLDRQDELNKGNLFLSQFDTEFNKLTRNSREQFESRLVTPKLEEAAAQTVKKLQLNDPERDFIDLAARYPVGHPKAGERIFKLLPKDDSVQSIYRMDLNVQATDTDVDNETGPHVSRNAEPIRLRIVSESDLLNEIGKEEIQLATRLDEALAKLAAAKRKYEFVRSTNGYKEEIPQNVDGVKVRSQDALGDVEKARDTVQSVAREYHRIYRECEVNRLNQPALKRYREFTEILDDVVSDRPDVPVTFPKTQALLTAVQNSLNGGKWASLALVTDAENSLYALEARLQVIRNMTTNQVTIIYLRNAAKKLKEDQERIEKDIAAWEDRLRFDLIRKYPTYVLPVVLSLAKGEEKKAELGISWNQYPGDNIVVKFAVYDDKNVLVTNALTVPAEMTLNFEKHQFRFELALKAGNKEGNYKVRMTPAAGPPVEFPVIVK